MNAYVLVAKNIVYNIPIIYHFKEKLESVTLVYDHREATQAIQLQQGLNYLRKVENLNFSISLYRVDEDSYSALSSFSPPLNSTLFISEQVDPTLSHFFSQAILKNKGKIVSYDKFENSYNIIDETGISNHYISSSVPLKTYFGMLGYEIEYNTPTLYNKKLAEKIFKNFKALHHYTKKGYPQKEIEEYTYRNGYRDFKSALGFAFEDFIYWKLFALDCDDILMGVKVTQDGVKNEFDMAMIKDNHLCLVECKYRRYLADANSLIYKLDALIDSFGEDTKALLIHIGQKASRTDKDNRFDTSSSLSYTANKRAIQNNIYIYHKHYFDPRLFYNRLRDRLGLYRRAFLLGECDLEMAEIKKTLIKYNQKVFNKLDKKEVKLSDYEEVFDRSFHFYGVKLPKDTNPPLLYDAIEEFSYSPALEQILSLLHITPNKFQKALIAYLKGEENSKDVERIKKLDKKLEESLA